MKQGIGPFKLGVSKSAVKMYKAGPAKKAGDGKKPIVNTDEMGRKGHFNPVTKSSVYKAGETEYAKPYQNKTYSTKGQRRQGVRGYSVGDAESDMQRRTRYNNVMGLRGQAYIAKENNFGVKKPKVKIK